MNISDFNSKNRAEMVNRILEKKCINFKSSLADGREEAEEILKEAENLEEGFIESIKKFFNNIKRHFIKHDGREKIKKQNNNLVLKETQDQVMSNKAFLDTNFVMMLRNNGLTYMADAAAINAEFMKKTIRELGNNFIFIEFLLHYYEGRKEFEIYDLIYNGIYSISTDYKDYPLIYKKNEEAIDLLIQCVRSIITNKRALEIFNKKSDMIMFKDIAFVVSPYYKKIENVYKSISNQRSEDHMNKLYESRFASGMLELQNKSLKEAENVESVNDKTTALNNLRSDIQDEYTAVKGYDAHADFAEKNGFSDIAEILRDIRDEEKVHIGELEAVMKKYDKEFKDGLVDGGKEAEEILKEDREYTKYVKGHIKNLKKCYLDESVAWDIDEFNTAEKIGKELSRLHSEKEKHLKDDDMPSMYYENIDKHIEELNKTMENFESKHEEKIQESRLPSDPSVDPQFGVPSQKKYPLFDEQHVRSAIKLFGHVDPVYERELARAIIAKMKKYNIPYNSVGPDNRLYKYIPEKFRKEE